MNDNDTAYSKGMGVAVGSEMGGDQKSGSIKEVGIEAHQAKHTQVGA